MCTWPTSLAGAGRREPVSDPRRPAAPVALGVQASWLTREDPVGMTPCHDQGGAPLPPAAFVGDPERFFAEAGSQAGDRGSRCTPSTGEAVRLQLNASSPSCTGPHSVSPAWSSCCWPRACPGPLTGQGLGPSLGLGLLGSMSL